VLRIAPQRDRKTIRDYIKMLPQIAGDGFKIIDFFPPYHGGIEYGGLDTIDFYNTRPDAGSLSDMREFIGEAHNLGVSVVAFINMGYCAAGHPDFIKACEDVRNQVQSRERGLFLWAGAPYLMEGPLSPFFLQDKGGESGEWVFSEAAGKYFWCKWFGVKGDVRLPQYWFGGGPWQLECAKIIRFWADVGFDGFIVDAVNWYTDCDWRINASAIVGPARERRRLFLQPEGAGGFADDPVPWITQGGYDCVQDYSLELWWEGVDRIAECLQKQDATPLWPVIEGYRNRVVDAGGVTYMGLGQGGGLKTPGEELVFKTALLIAIGEMLNFDLSDWGQIAGAALTPLFNMQNSIPALSPYGKRTHIEAPANPEIFILKCMDNSNDFNKFVTAVFNFGVDEYVYASGDRQIPVAPRGFCFLDSDGAVIARLAGGGAEFPG